MQTKAQRRHWARKREAQRAIAAQVPKPHVIRLLATSVEEYQKLVHEYPNMPVRLADDATKQGELFNGGGYHDV